MKQSKRAEKRAGAELFDEYYGALFGGRWAGLRDALLGGTDSREYRVPRGREPYFLDAASIRAAAALPLQNARHILDLCAAPGGKTLVLASLMGETAELLSNERSAARAARLRTVCDTCLPPDIRERVRISCKDGATLCLAPENSELFDAILLDAPCSSERHVLNDKNHLARWSPARTRALSFAQWSLISSAWRMLKNGGFLLYATCALAEAENDGAIEKLLKRFPEASVREPRALADISRFSRADLPACEMTRLGARILPDAAGGAGPLFFSLIQKGGA